jgi:hypothetical protein
MYLSLLLVCVFLVVFCPYFNVVVFVVVVVVFWSCLVVLLVVVFVFCFVFCVALVLALVLFLFLVVVVFRTDGWSVVSIGFCLSVSAFFRAEDCLFRVFLCWFFGSCFALLGIVGLRFFREVTDSFGKCYRFFREVLPTLSGRSDSFGKLTDSFGKLTDSFGTYVPLCLCLSH